MRKANQIPIRSLEKIGRSYFKIERIEPNSSLLDNYPIEEVHRDDYYVLIFQESGNSSIVVDFQEYIVSGNAIFCIQPGQVHLGSFSSDTCGWAISVTAEWVPSEFRLFLMENAVCHHPLSINSTTGISLFNNTFNLFEQVANNEGLLSEQLVKSMFEVCLQLFIQTFQKAISNKLDNDLRPIIISRQFRSLLLSQFNVMKRTSEYATALNISPSYLNEVVKETTGHPVSYWIQQEIILEAKRNLYYTKNTVKEIAYALGYTDPAYFIRLFKKVSGLSPLQFRQKYHK